jgi:hypothetical protein
MPDPLDEIDQILAKQGIVVLHMYGYCLRYPPIAQPQEGQVAVPVTDYDDWCGEWKQ